MASGLLTHWDVTIVEINDAKPALQDRVIDKNIPAKTYPHIQSGYGGTSQVWHNALMEVNETVFKNKWPFPKKVFAPYYEKAYLALSGINRNIIYKSADTLQSKLVEIGFDKKYITQNMFIPLIRVNAWEKLKLKGKVNTINGEVTELLSSPDKTINGVNVQTANGNKTLVADVVVLAAGGLGTPLLLQKLSKVISFSGSKHAGCNYEDHPCAIVGEIELSKPLYKYWNYPLKINKVKGCLRLPLNLTKAGLNISFHLRPAHELQLLPPRKKVMSMLTEIRNYPYRIKNYFKLLRYTDDILEIISFKYNLRLPTRKYSILMISEQEPSSYKAVWKTEGAANIYRKWEINSNFADTVNDALDECLSSIKPITKSFTFYSDWSEDIYSSSHHSGTARISKTSDTGVCDANGKVYDLKNLYICDGSILPGTGFSNTGLSIVAWAFKMADHLNDKYIHGKNAI